MVNFPKYINHKYLGPGNPLDNGNPVDSADHVARSHDIRYDEISHSDLDPTEHFRQVQEADNTSANQFYNQYRQDGNLWNIVGAVGLNIKSAVEGTLGKVIYPRANMGGTPNTPNRKRPRMDPDVVDTPHRINVARPHRRLDATPAPAVQSSGRLHRIGGQFQSGNLKRAEERMEKLLVMPASVKRDKEIAAQQKKLDRLYAERNQWARAKAADKEVREMFAADAVNNDVADPYEIGPDELGGAGPGPMPRTLFDDPVQIQRNEAYEEMVDDQQGHRDILAEAMEEINVPDDRDILAEAMQEIGNLGPELTEDDGIFSLGGTEEGDEMAGVSQIIRSKPPQLNGNQVVFSGSRLMYSWGYNFGVQDVVDPNDVAVPPTVKQKWLQTPMAYIPVDWVPFYMSKSEFDDLPLQSRIVKVSAKVIPWGSRTSFTTAAETSKPATAQHIVTGICGIGLNTEMSWANRDVTNDDSMTISTSSKFNDGTLIEKYWGKANDFTVIPTCFGAIRSMDSYGGPVVDPQLVTPASDSQGFCFLDRHVNRFDMAYQKGKPILNYEYEPKDGFLKRKNPMLCRHRTALGQEIYVSDALAGADAKYGANTALDSTTGQLTLKSYPLQNVFDSSSYLSYNQIVEKGNFTHRLQKEQGCKPQPQIHCGILPVFANTPTSTGIICAAAFWQIDYECVVEVNFGSFLPLQNLLPPTINHRVLRDALDDANNLQGSHNGYAIVQKAYSA